MPCSATSSGATPSGRPASPSSAPCWRTPVFGTSAPARPPSDRLPSWKPFPSAVVVLATTRHIGPSAVQTPLSAIAAREQELRAGLEGFGTRHEEPEGAGQPIDRVEGGADRERVLDLLARDAGSQDRAHVVRIY